MNKNAKLLVISALAVVVALLVGWAGSYRGQSVGDATGATGMKLFLLAVIASIVIQWIGFVPSYLQGTEKYYDLFGGIGYVVGTVGILALTPTVGTLGWVLGAMVIVWSLRLAGFLFYRILSTGGDGRFDDIKTQPARLFLTWTLQALWVSFAASAAWIGISSTVVPGLTWVSWVGIAIWVVGIAVEITADVHKQIWRKSHDSKTEFITGGVWSLSRHPNYFGEITLWIGVLIAAAPALTGWQWVAVISPLFTVLLLTKVSGIPLQAKTAEERFGGQPEWEEYKAHTPVLVPFIGRRG